jgi:hypothetical protein
MKYTIRYKFIRSLWITFFAVFFYTVQLSPAAEVAIGSMCWHTVSTLLKVCSSGFATDFCHRIQELKKQDALKGRSLIDTLAKAIKSGRSYVPTRG